MTLFLQGHILQPRGPRHPRPAPLVLQVLVSQHGNDWVEVEGLGILGSPTPFSPALLSPPVLLSPDLSSSLIVCETSLP
jgi:hypothetical protein